MPDIELGSGDFKYIFRKGERYAKDAVRITNQSTKTVEEQTICSITKEVLQKKTKRPITEFTILLVSKEKNWAKVKINGKTRTVRLQQGNKDYTVVSAGKQPFKVANKKRFATVFQQLPFAVKVLSLFPVTTLIALPIVISRYLTETSAEKRIATSVQEYLRSQTPDSFEKFLQQIKGYSGKNQDQIEQVLSIIESPDRKEEKMAELLESENSLLMPGGYYNGGRFQPVLWTITKKEEEFLLVAQDLGQLANTYTFSFTGSKEDLASYMLNQLEQAQQVQTVKQENPFPLRDHLYSFLGNPEVTGGRFADIPKERFVIKNQTYSVVRGFLKKLEERETLKKKRKLCFESSFQHEGENNYLYWVIKETKQGFSVSCQDRDLTRKTYTFFYSAKTSEEKNAFFSNMASMFKNSEVTIAKRGIEKEEELDQAVGVIDSINRFRIFQKRREKKAKEVQFAQPITEKTQQSYFFPLTTSGKLIEESTCSHLEVCAALLQDETLVQEHVEGVIEQSLQALEKAGKHLAEKDREALIDFIDQRLQAYQLREGNQVALVEIFQKRLNRRREIFAEKKAMGAVSFGEVEKSEKKGKKLKVNADPILLQKKEAIDQLRSFTNLETLDTKKFFSQFAALTAEVDSLVENKQYKAALDLSKICQRALPQPDSEFWHSMENTSRKELQECSLQISHLVKLQSEASLRLNRASIDGDEACDLFNSRIALYQLTMLQSRALCQEKRLQIPIAEWDSGWQISRRYPFRLFSRYDIENYKDRGCTAKEIAEIALAFYGPDTFQIESILQSHPLYQISTNPGMTKRIDAVVKYAKKIGNGVRFDATLEAERTDKNENIKGILNNLYQEFLDKEISDDYDFVIGMQKKDPFLPDTMRQRAEHDVWVQLMLRPTISRSIYFGKSGLRSKLRAVAWLMKKIGQMQKICAEKEQSGEKVKKKSIMLDLAQQDLQDRWATSKGRLSIKPEPYLFEEGGATFVIESTKGKHRRFYYTPWGTGLESLGLDPTALGGVDPSSLGVDEKRFFSFLGKKKEQKCAVVNHTREKRRKDQAPDVALRSESALFEEVNGDIVEFLLSSLSIEDVEEGYGRRRVELASTSDQQALEVLSLLARRADLAADPKVRAELALYLRRSGALSSLSKNHPDLVISYANQLAEQVCSLAKKEPKIAAFFLHVGEVIQENLENPEQCPLGYRKTYTDERGEEIHGMDLVLEMVSAIPDIATEALVEGFLLGHEVAEENGVVCNKVLLRAKATFQNPGEHLAGPKIADRLRLEYLQKISSISTDEEKISIAHSMIQDFDNQCRQDQWKKVKGSSFVYQNRGWRVDLSLGLIVNKKGVVVSSEKQKVVFPQRLAKQFPILIKSDSLPSYAEREWTPSGGQVYRFTVGSETYAIEVDSEGDAQLVSLWQNNRYIWQQAEGAKGWVGSLANEVGIWVKEGSSQVHIKLTDLSSNNPEERIVCRKKGKEMRAKMQQSKDNPRSVQVRATTRKEQYQLQALHPDHVVAQTSKKKVVAYYSLDQNDQFLVDEEGIHHPKKKGFVLDRDPQQEWAKALGTDVALHFVNQEKTTALLWPHRLIKERGQVKVEKESSMQEARSYPTLSIDLSSQQGSPAALLYVAYVLNRKGEYEKAQKCMTKALEGALETEEEKKAFERVVFLWEEMEPESVEERKIWVKGMLAIQELERAESGKRTYNSVEGIDFQKRMEKICRVYLAYERHCLPEKIALDFTQEEQKRVQMYRAQAMVALLSDQKNSTLLPQYSPTKALSGDLLQWVVSHPKSSEGIDQLPKVLTAEYIEKNVDSLLGAALKGTFAVEDWNVFFQPLEDERGFSLTMAQKRSFENLNEFRSLLLTIVHDNDSSRTTEKEEFLTILRTQVKVYHSTGGKKLTTDEVEGLQYFFLRSVVVPEKVNTVTPLGFVPPTLPGEIDVKEALKNFEQVCDLMQIQDTSAEKEIIQQVLENTEKTTLSLQEVLIALEMSKVSLQDMHVEGVAKREIQQLEQDLRKREILKEKVQRIQQRVESGEPITIVQPILLSWEKALTERIEGEVPEDLKVRHEKLSKELPKSLKQIFSGEDTESKEIQDSIAATRERLEQQIDFDRRLPFKQTNEKISYQSTRNHLDQQLKIYSSQSQHLQKALQENPQNLFPNIEDQDRLDALLDSYQRLENLDSRTEREITEYLLVNSARQQLEKALGHLDKIETRANQVVQDPNQDPDLIEESRKFFETVRHNLNLTRYVENGKLKNPGLYRKILVAENRMGIVMRKGQQEALVALQKDPTKWVSLRMGEGKTFFIMPVVAELLIERGLLPIMIVPDQLQQMNRQDFDRTTRNAFKTRGEVFKLELEKGCKPGDLATAYHSLLKLRKDNRYAVTSVAQLASIRNRIPVLREERAELLQELEALVKTESDKKKIFLDIGARLQEISLSIHYLEKMEELLFSDEMPVFRFADEADSTVHISKDVNSAIGNQVSLNKKIIAQYDRVFSLLVSYQGDNENLQDLAHRLENGTQGGLQAERVKKEFLPLIVKMVLKDPDIKKVLELKENADIKVLQEYFLKGSQSIPGDCNQELLNALGHVLRSLPTVLTMGVGDTLRLESDEGMQAIPTSAGGNEVKGTRFGDECVLIGAQFLAYYHGNQTAAKGGKTLQFYEKALGYLALNKPKAFTKIQEAIRVDDKQELAKELLLNQKYKEERIILLRHAVFGNQKIKRFSKQSKLPTHAVMAGKNRGGVTGTLKRYLQPGFDAKKEVDNPNTDPTWVVEVETFIRMAAKLEKGFDQEIELIDDENPQACQDRIIKKMKNPSCRAVILEEGYGMEGKSGTEFVSSLRSHVQRDFLYIGENGKPWLWKKGAGLPTEADVKKLKKQGFSGICLYTPEYTRGTDLPIGVGDVYYFAKRAPKVEDMSQSVWRARGLGDRHCLVPIAPKSSGLKENSTLKEMIQWVVRQSAAEAKPLAFRAEQLRAEQAILDGIPKALAVPLEPVALQMIRDEEETRIVNEEKVMSDQFFRSALHEHVSEYQIDTRTTDLQAPLGKTEEQKAVDSLQKKAEAAVTKLQQKKEGLSKLLADKMLHLKNIINKKDEDEAQMNEQRAFLSTVFTKVLPRVQEGGEDAEIEAIIKEEIERSLSKEDLAGIDEAIEEEIGKQVLKTVQDEGIAQELKNKEETLQEAELRISKQLRELMKPENREGKKYSEAVIEYLEELIHKKAEKAKEEAIDSILQDEQGAKIVKASGKSYGDVRQDFLGLMDPKQRDSGQPCSAAVHDYIKGVIQQEAQRQKEEAVDSMLDGEQGQSLVQLMGGDKVELKKELLNLMDSKNRDPDQSYTDAVQDYIVKNYDQSQAMKLSLVKRVGGFFSRFIPKSLIDKGVEKKIQESFSAVDPETGKTIADEINQGLAEEKKAIDDLRQQFDGGLAEEIEKDLSQEQEAVDQLKQKFRQKDKHQQSLADRMDQRVEEMPQTIQKQKDEEFQNMIDRELGGQKGKESVIHAVKLFSYMYQGLDQAEKKAREKAETYHDQGVQSVHQKYVPETVAGSVGPAASEQVQQQQQSISKGKASDLKGFGRDFTPTEVRSFTLGGLGSWCPWEGGKEMQFSNEAEKFYKKLQESFPGEASGMFRFVLASSGVITLITKKDLYDLRESRNYPTLVVVDPTRLENLPILGRKEILLGEDKQKDLAKAKLAMGMPLTDLEQRLMKKYFQENKSEYREYTRWCTNRGATPFS